MVRITLFLYEKQKTTPIGVVFGAGNQNRTDDLVITNDVLYRLSHTSMLSRDFVIISNANRFVNSFFEKRKYFFAFLQKSRKSEEKRIGRVLTIPILCAILLK